MDLVFLDSDFNAIKSVEYINLDMTASFYAGIIDNQQGI